MENNQKTNDSKHRLPPIIVVPDKSYIDDKGYVIPTEVILITDLNIYYKMHNLLTAWGKEQIGIPGKRGDVDG